MNEKEVKDFSQTYKDVATMQSKPPAFVTSEAALRELWGDDAVDRGLAEGSIRILEIEDDQEETDS